MTRIATAGPGAIRAPVLLLSTPEIRAPAMASAQRVTVWMGTVVRVAVMVTARRATGTIHPAHKGSAEALA